MSLWGVILNQTRRTEIELVYGLLMIDWRFVFCVQA